MHSKRVSQYKKIKKKIIKKEGCNFWFVYLQEKSELNPHQVVKEN
jgi:hypothetical protein